MRFTSSLVVARAVRFIVGISLVLGVLRQPVMAQEVPPPKIM